MFLNLVYKILISVVNIYWYFMGKFNELIQNQIFFFQGKKIWWTKNVLTKKKCWLKTFFDKNILLAKQMFWTESLVQNCFRIQKKINLTDFDKIEIDIVVRNDTSQN